MNNNHIKDKSNAGGSATGGGINYQARVTAITYVHLLRGTPLSWLENIINDTPISICAETGGSGDDISVSLKTGKIVEIQVKKRLSSGSRLWSSLIKLATAINNDEINYGILVVCPSSSGTIKEQLSRDIVRLGDGRNDNLSKKGTEFTAKLKELNLPILKCCQNLRIQTVNAISSNNSDIKSVKSELAYICDESTNIESVWDALCIDASNLIEVRGRRELSSLHRVLKAKSVLLKSDVTNSAVNLLDKINKWTIATHSHFSIIGIKKELSIDDAWIPIRISISDIQAKEKFENIDKAIVNYQSYGQQLNSADLTYINPETLAKFKTRTILIGGPGMGKTTLLKRIACSYSKDSIPVLNVRLSRIAMTMQNGSCFEDALFILGLDASSISQSDIKDFKITKWLILCDGLDECGYMSQQVSEGIKRFSQGYKESKFIVTTRPIGYETNLFSDWSHYQIAPLETNSLIKNLSRLISASANSSKQQNDFEKISGNILKNDLIKSLVGRSPLMLGFAASIIINGEDIAETKTKLYQQIFNLIQNIPNNRNRPTQIDSVISNRFIEILGWYVTLNPFCNKSVILRLCSIELANETNNTELNALSESSNYLQYWIDVGIIEEISYSNEKYLVFIHKSFGEFSAAQYLSLMSSDEQRKNIKEFVSKPKWFEVVNFYARLGCSDIVLPELITSENITKIKTEKIYLALEIIIELKQTTNKELRNDIFSEAFKIITSEYRIYALDVGAKLIQAAIIFQDEIGQLSSQYLEISYKWSKLIMWHIVINCGFKYYKEGSLVKFLQLSKKISEPTLISSENGGLIFNSYSERKIQQAFTIKASQILYNSNKFKYKSIIFNALNNNDLHTVSFVDEVNKLSIVVDNKWPIGRNDYYTNQSMGWIEVLEKARKPEYTRYKLIFEALGVDLEQTTDYSNFECLKNLLNLSAFLASSKYWKIPFTDVWNWNCGFDRKATIETIRSFAKICNLDLVKLRSDAQIASIFLDANNEGRLSTILTEVDPPEFNWRSASGIDINKIKIEAALYHPSEWIIYLAANLMDNILDKNELEQLIKRLFIDGKDSTLWAASALTSNLPKAKALNLIINRLNKPLNNGCKYLFIVLKKFDFDNINQLLELLKIGLYDSANIAFETANLALKNYHKEKSYKKIISEALVYWDGNEKLKPDENSTIPPNPRKILLKCLIKVKDLSYSEIISYINDSDSDVSSIGIEQLKLFLAQDRDKTNQVLNDLLTEKLPIRIISKVMCQDVNFKFRSDELQIITELLTHTKGDLRTESMKLLGTNCFSENYINTRLKILCNDSDQNIRDGANKLQETVTSNTIM